MEDSPMEEDDIEDMEEGDVSDPEDLDEDYWNDRSWPNRVEGLPPVDKDAEVADDDDGDAIPTASTSASTSTLPRFSVSSRTRASAPLDNPWAPIDLASIPKDPVAHDDGEATKFTCPPGGSRTLHTNRSFIYNAADNRGNLVDRLLSDPLTEERLRLDNIYFPYAGEREWLFAQWLEERRTALADQDAYWKSPAWNGVDGINIKTGDQARAAVERLPQPPRWKAIKMTMSGYRTKEPIVFFFRDGAECIQYIFANPIFAGCIDTTPYMDYLPGKKRAIKDFMSADLANNIASKIPAGETVLGVVCSSDKTPLTVGTGNRQMHPFLLSLANIHASVRMKASSQAFVIAAYIPTPKFLNVSAEEQAILSARLLHNCVEVCTRSLQEGCKVPIPMCDPLGSIRKARTPLAAYIGDNPEHLTLAIAASKRSPVTVAEEKQFGDSTQHALRTHKYILAQIDKAIAEVQSKGGSPNDLRKYYTVIKKYGLNGVIAPFWRNWGADGIYWADPSEFLTPDLLHLVHKFFWDHVVKHWTVWLLGKPGFDLRLSGVQPATGKRYWRNGMSTLKQITGAEYRELERFVVPMLAGAEKVTPAIYRSIYALMSFIFRAQGIQFTEHDLAELDRCLADFHKDKQAVLEAGCRRGAKKAITNWHIPKLEGLLNISRSIRLVGAAFQWSADPTERMHQIVKRHYEGTNGVDFVEQCARHLDREEKVRLFSLQLKYIQPRKALPSEDVKMRVQALILQGYPEKAWDVERGHRSPDKTFFDNRAAWGITPPCLPDDTLFAAIRLVVHPPHIRVKLREFEKTWKIVNLNRALDIFVNLNKARTGIAQSRATYPFSMVQVWDYFRVQHQSSIRPGLVSRPETVHARRANAEWPHGQFTPILIAHPDGEYLQTEQLSERYMVVQVKAIFQGMITHPTEKEKADKHVQQPVLLVQAFKFVPFNDDDWINENGRRMLKPRGDVSMYRVTHQIGEGRRPLELITSLRSYRRVLELVPAYGRLANTSLRYNSSFSVPGTHFHINPFADNETYHSMFSKL